MKCYICEGHITEPELEEVYEGVLKIAPCAECRHIADTLFEDYEESELKENINNDY